MTYYLSGFYLAFVMLCDGRGSLVHGIVLILNLTWYLINHNAVKMNGVMETLDVSGWSGLYPGHFTHRKRFAITCSLGGCRPQNWFGYCTHHEIVSQG